MKSQHSKKILILGGYGNVGAYITSLLLRESSVEIVIAGRNSKKAEILSEKCNTEFPGNRVTSKYVDVSKIETLKEALTGVNLLLIASSTAKYTDQIAALALDLNCDYYDIHFGSEVYAKLSILREKIENKKLCFITGGGIHPGFPSAIIRYISTYFDSILDAMVGSVMNLDYHTYKFSPSSRMEFLEELMDFQSLYYKNGKWINASFYTNKDLKEIDFGSEFGKKYCAPMFFEELRVLPESYPSLKNIGFFIAGFNPIADYIVFPILFLLLKILPSVFLNPLSLIMVWSLKNFSKPPYKIIMKIIGKGIIKGEYIQKEMTVSHSDGSYFTAVAVVSCLLQYLEDASLKPGLHLQANYVEPQRFVKDLIRMEINIEKNEFI
jgi:hypothetical protein